MKRILFIASLLFIQTVQVYSQTLTSGNIVVLRIGDSTTTLASTGNTLALDQFTGSGTYVNSVIFPKTGSSAICLSGTATSEGGLTLSSNFTSVNMAGYKTAAPYASSVSATTTATVNRAIANITASGTFSIPTLTATGYSANNPRCATSNGSGYWVAGANTGISYGTSASNADTIVSATLTNIRSINVFTNQLYFSTGSGTRGIYRVGSGMPSNSRNTSVIYIATGSSSSPYQFSFSADTTICYIADDQSNSSGGIQKWTRSGSTWSLSYVLGTGVTNIGARGITVDWRGSNPIIYATTAEASANRVIKITDAGSSSTATTLATAVSNTIFRGIAFTPGTNPFTSSVTPLTGTTSQTNVSCFGGNNGVATVNNVSGGLGSYSYSWSPAGGTNATATNLIAGTYTCTVIDSIADTLIKTITITQPTIITASISAQTNVSCYGGNNGSVTITASGGTGSLSYIWSPSGGTSSNATSLAAGVYTCTITDSNSCSKIILDTILQPAVLANNTISSSQTICSGSTPSTLTGALPTGGNGTYTYSWLSSTTNATSGFAVASGTNNTSGYSPASLSQTTWFRRVVTSGACANDTTTAVQVTVNTAIANNTASGAQAICSGSTPTALTGSTPTGGNGSTYTYGLLSSTTNATSGFALASGTNNTSGYSPASLSQTTWYRRVVTSGACSADTTTAVAITVNTAIANNTASGAQAICSGSTPTALTGSTPTGGNGSTYTYGWLSSTTNATLGFALASGTNNTSGYSPASLSQTTWYRRVVTSGACANDTTTAVAITVGTAGTWVGATSSAWGNTANWSCPQVPTSSTNVTIPSGTTNSPIISDVQQANNVTIASGATLTINNASSLYTINGALAVSGTLTHSNGEIVFGGTIAQTIPAGTYNRLTVNNASGVVLGGNITLNDSLKMNNGNVNLGAYNLTIAGTNGIVSNAATSRFIANTGTGALTIQNIGSTGRTGAVSFPVGKSSYNPLTITNTGTIDNFTVLLIDSVTNAYTGTTPTGSKLTSNVVNRTWIVNEAVAGGSNATVSTQWATTDELTGFTRTSSYLARYTGTNWSSATSVAASGSNPYTQTQTGITSFSPFAVGSGGTVPVELLTFTGNKKGKMVELNWVTTSEINNDYFIVERSEDGKVFTQVGKVRGQGNSNRINNYSLLNDISAMMEQQVPTLYYRLTQVDFDGKAIEERIISVNLDKNISGINLSANPNPFRTGVTLNINTSKEEAINIKMMDMSGRVIREEASTVSVGDNAIEMNNLEELKDGMYIIQVTTHDGTLIHKVVKQD